MTCPPEEVFPFGSPVLNVEQRDRRPKKVFVLGVYASAVHARWYGPNGRLLVRALAVASEPEIFWRGEEAGEIIAGIDIPPACGRLEPADPIYNGPSGKVLDELFLDPLGFLRSDAWLCDLLPRSRMNPAQKAAIDKHYVPPAAQGLVPAVTWRRVPRKFSNMKRNEEILDEVRHSRAELLVRDFINAVTYYDRHFPALWGILPPTQGGNHASQEPIPDRAVRSRAGLA